MMRSGRHVVGFGLVCAAWLVTAAVALAVTIFMI